MMRHVWVAALIMTACGEAAPQPGTVDDLVRRERAFAALSVDSGIKPAFLAFLADSSVLFRPGPVPGRAFTAGRPNPPGVLNWHPTQAMMAGSRDLGWTTGPYSYALHGDTAWGHFVSVWRRQDEGPWEVLIDLGVSHPRDTIAGEGVETEQLESAEATVATAALRIDLLQRDRLVLATARRNTHAAFEDAYTANAWLYRDGSVPMRLDAARVDRLPATPGMLSWEPSDARVAAGGDLGFTYGTLTSDGDSVWMLPSGAYQYVRIWRMVGGRWSIILEIVV